jgi:hypothetical protein
MAIGDLVGDLATAYLTPAQRAAQLAKAAQPTSGPIARASDQLSKVAGLGSVAPVAAGQPTAPAQQPATGLASAFSNPAQFAAPPQVTAPQSLASLSPVVPAQAANTPSFPVAPPAGQADVAAAAQSSTAISVPQPQQPASLDQAYRPTGVGTGNSAIVGRIGAGGVPQFSNQPADIASASGAAPVGPGAQMPSSLADLSPGGRSADPSAPLSNLGSAANLGDGVGTFSQGQAGDSQLALTRFQRANDLRDGYKAQDSADLAQARARQGATLNIVRDSSQPLTKADVAAANLDRQQQAGLEQNAAGAQKSLEDLRAGQIAETQGRQSQRLEDAFTAATAPNATTEQKLRYQTMLDPTGANTLKTQQAQAQLANTQADGLIKQQELQQRAQAQQQAAQDRTRGQAGQVATIDQALSSVDSLLGTKVDPKNPTGKRLDEDPGLENAVGFSSILPTRPGSKAADFEARLDTLKAQSFLPQVALLKGAGALSDAEGKKLSDSIGALSPKMSEEAFRKSLGEIRTTFAASRERLGATATAPGSTAAVTAAPQPAIQAAPAIPTITSKAQADALPAGSVFIGPDGKQYRK